MNDKPVRNSSFDISVLDQLACPVCMGALRLDGERLICAACVRRYPIVDGIPVLIAGRAEADFIIDRAITGNA